MRRNIVRVFLLIALAGVSISYALTTQNLKNTNSKISLKQKIPDSTKQDQLNSEYYDLSVFVDANKTIQSIKVLDYFSDYGYEITSKRYLKKYVGKTLCDFSTKSDLVDGISGATMSYNGLVNSLIEFCELTP